LSASEHSIILGDFNVNCNTTPSLYEKVVQHFKTDDLQQCVTNPTTIYGSTLDFVFTGGHLPSIIYNGCYYSDHMTLLIQKKIK
jgi:endonuclease/exonuclease/phosphatase family metal-dependent hydrolase